MPPSGYLSTSGIEASVAFLSNAFPSITDLIVLPETSVEGRTSRALKIANGSGDRTGVLFIGGQHARELVNPDCLVSLALRICQSYTNGTDIVLGTKTWSASTVKLFVDALDIFVFPLVNPDGRTYVQVAGGDPWWRKNRRVNAGSSCRGVDLNRNYDFLSAFAIGQTSANPCSDTYKGPSGFSEPETRNVRWLLDTYPGISTFVDVHSYSELVLYPWGDDDNQSVDPSQNFQNPAFDGLRGVLGTGYAEYIHPGDWARFVDHGGDVRDSIAAVRGRVYTVEEASDLYTTCGSAEDYAFSRHLVDPTKTKAWGYTLETGTEFQPPFPEAQEVMDEAQSGLLQFLASAVCPIVDSGAAAGLSARSIDNLRVFRDTSLATNRRGRELVRLMEHHAVELSALAADDSERAREATKLLARVSEVVDAEQDGQPVQIDDRLVDDARHLLERVTGSASASLARALKDLSRDVEGFRSATLRQGLDRLDERQGGGERQEAAAPDSGG